MRLSISSQLTAHCRFGVWKGVSLHCPFTRHDFDAYLKVPPVCVHVSSYKKSSVQQHLKELVGCTKAIFSGKKSAGRGKSTPPSQRALAKKLWVCLWSSSSKFQRMSRHFLSLYTVSVSQPRNFIYKRQTSLKTFCPFVAIIDFYTFYEDSQLFFHLHASWIHAKTVRT